MPPFGEDGNRQRELWDRTMEQAVIGAILHTPSCLAEVMPLVSCEDFFFEQHREAMRAILDLHDEGEPIDLAMVLSRCRDQATYLGQMAVDSPFSPGNVRQYAAEVREWSRRRSIYAACMSAVEGCFTKSAGEVSTELVGAIEQAGERAIGSAMSFREVIDAAVASIEEASEHGRGGVVGVPTGIPIIDQATGGLCPPRLVVLAARPSVGKTALANQFALHAARNGHPIGICSLEMGEDEIGMRAMANTYGINLTKLMRGEQSAIAQMFEGSRKNPIVGLPIHLDTATYSLTGIEARIAGWVREHGIKVAIVDYIGQVEVERGERMSANDRIGLVTRRLKKLAKRLNVCVLALAQLNRESERDNRRPKLSELRSSGEVEQDCDIAMFLHTPSESRGSGQIEVEVGFLKNRTGRCGWMPQKLDFDGATQRFREITDQWGGPE